MSLVSRTFGKILAAVVTLTLIAASAGPGLDRARVEREASGIALEIRKDVSKRRSDAILKYLPADGMGCGEAKIPRAQVEREIGEKGAYLNAVLFDTPTLRKQYPQVGRLMSLADFFRKARSLYVVVTFVNFPNQDPYAYPCAAFHAANMEESASVCFFRREDRWWLTDSFYECD